MAGPRGELPPEVPDEFAEAYRAAYERALAAQSESDHRRAPEPTVSDDPGELPVRQGRLRIGTHREPPVEPEPRPPGHRPPWLAPVLLLVLALVLVLGAYVVGRVFAASVG